MISGCGSEEVATNLWSHRRGNVVNRKDHALPLCPFASLGLQGIILLLLLILLQFTLIPFCMLLRSRNRHVMSLWICSACLDIVITTQEECIGSGKSFVFTLSCKESGAFQMGPSQSLPLGFTDCLQETTLTISLCVSLNPRKVLLVTLDIFSYNPHYFPTGS